MQHKLSHILSAALTGKMTLQALTHDTSASRVHLAKSALWPAHMENVQIPLREGEEKRRGELLWTCRERASSGPIGREQ